MGGGADAGGGGAIQTKTPPPPPHSKIGGGGAKKTPIKSARARPTPPRRALPPAPPLSHWLTWAAATATKAAIAKAANFMMKERDERGG